MVAMSAGRPVRAGEVGRICGITMMAAAWSLRRLVMSGDVIRYTASGPCDTRQTEIVTTYVHAPHVGRIAAGSLPAWLMSTCLPPFVQRRTVVGVAGMLAGNEQMETMT